MLKKGICLYTFLTIITLFFGIHQQKNREDLGLYKVHTVEDLKTLKIWVEEFESEDTKGSRLEFSGVKELAQEYLDTSSYAIVGRATGDLQLYVGSTSQEIIVEKIIDLSDFSEITSNSGLAEKGEKVWITQASGFQIRGEEEKHISYFDQWINIMEKGDKYLIFVDGNSYNKYLSQKVFSTGELFYGYFNMTKDKAFVANVTYDKAQLCDFKGSEVLTTQKEEVEYYLELKRILFKACGVKLEVFANTSGRSKVS